jgi:hypothetical protein
VTALVKGQLWLLALVLNAKRNGKTVSLQLSKKILGQQFLS